MGRRPAGGRPRRPRVLFFAEAGPEQPCAFYRAFLPARALRMARWRADVTLDGAIFEDGRFGDRGQPEAPEIAVIRRPIAEDGVSTLDIAGDVAAAVAAGQRVYVDLDDDLWNLPPTNPAVAVMTPESNAAFERVINAATGALVSTPGLAASLATHVGVPVHVCPNGIDPSLFRLRAGDREPLRVGWLGPVKWRHDDLRSIAGWLVPFLNERAGKVEFWHLGAMPSDQFGVADILEGLEVPLHTVPWVPFQCLEQSLAEVDVLVVPQRRGGVYEAFANARSPTSAIAAIAAGAAVWATPIDSYVGLFGDALPAELAELVDDPEARRLYRRRQRRMLDRVNLPATAAHYETVFLS